MALSVGYAHWHYSADIPNIHNVGGWCWAEGEIDEFIGAKGLRTDVIWLTNLPWEYHVALGASLHRHIKRNDFLPVPLDRLAQELNIGPDQQELYANAVSVIGSRLIALGQRSYGNKLLEQCLDQNTLAQAIAHSLGWSPFSSVDFLEDELHQDIIWRNLAPYALLRHDAPRENCAVLRADWFEHAKHVLSCPLPTLHEPWVEVDVAQDQRLRYLQQEDLPAIVEVTDVGLTSSWSSIYDFSSTPHRWSRRRKWMCSAEVLFLAEVGAIQIGRIFVQPTGYVCDAITSALPNAGNALALSLSAGMLAHAHWMSGAIPLTHRFWPMRAMWLRAADRLRLATMLPALQGIAGLKLVSYGEGAVYVDGTAEALQEAIKRCPQVGLSPTPSAWARAGKTDITRDAAWAPAALNAYQQTALRMSSRPLPDLLRLDAASIYSLTDERAAVLEIAGIIKEVTNAT